MYKYDVVFYNYDYSESFIVEHDIKFSEKEFNKIVTDIILAQLEANDARLEKLINNSDNPDGLFRYSKFIDIDYDELQESLINLGFTLFTNDIEQRFMFDEDNVSNKKIKKFIKERDRKFFKLLEKHEKEQIKNEN